MHTGVWWRGSVAVGVARERAEKDCRLVHPGDPGDWSINSSKVPGKVQLLGKFLSTAVTMWCVPGHRV